MMMLDLSTILFVFMLSMLLLAWVFLRKQLSGKKDLNLSSQETSYGLMNTHDQQDMQYSEARYFINTNYIKRSKLADYGRIMLGFVLIMLIPILALCYLANSNTELLLWLILLNIIFFLMATKFSLSGFNYLQNLHYRIESALLKGEPGLIVSESGLFVSVATVPGSLCHFQNDQTGKFLKQQDILSLEIQYIRESKSSGCRWFLIVKTKTDQYPYYIKLDSLVATRKQITDSIQKLLPMT